MNHTAISGGPWISPRAPIGASNQIILWRNFHHLPSCCESRGQPFRKICGQNFFLCRAQFVGHAEKADNALLRVKHRKGGPPVAITRLSNRSRINHVLYSLFKAQIPCLLLCDRLICGTRRPHEFAAQLEPTLNVSVSEKRYIHPRLHH